MLACCEAWLRSDECDEQVSRDMCPTGYECVSVLKGLRVGVVGLLKKKKKRIYAEA